MSEAVTILQGDVFDRLLELADESVDCVVVSPPYWGLRDYGTGRWDGGDTDCQHERSKGKCTKCEAEWVDGQIGLEPTLGEHLDVMVSVFAEVWRVLKPTGTVWLNYGDCYATAPNGRSAAATKANGSDDRTFRDKPMSTSGPIYASGKPFPDDVPRRGGGPGAFAGAVYEAQPDGRQNGRRGRGGNLGNGGQNGTTLPTGRIVSGGVLKPKDLCMIPNRLAIALQEWGWWVRSEIIWGKPNGMPDSSGVQRPATAHEKVFLLVKSTDAEVWRARDTGEVSFEPDLSETCPYITNPDKIGARWERIGAFYDAAAVKVQASFPNGPNAPDKIKSPMGQGYTRRAEKPVAGWASGQCDHSAAAWNNGDRKDKQRGHSRRHAGFNDRWDKMSAKEQRGKGRLLRNYEPAPVEVWRIATAAYRDAHFATFPPELVERCLLAGCPPGGHVLDPFGGAGTTALVARALGMTATLIELNEDYVTLARERLEGPPLERAGVDGTPSLFETREEV